MLLPASVAQRPVKLTILAQVVGFLARIATSRRPRHYSLRATRKFCAEKKPRTSRGSRRAKFLSAVKDEVADGLQGVKGSLWAFNVCR